MKTVEIIIIDQKINTINTDKCKNCNRADKKCEGVREESGNLSTWLSSLSKERNQDILFISQLIDV